jgi:hypothetical protein
LTMSETTRKALVATGLLALLALVAGANWLYYRVVLPWALSP